MNQCGIYKIICLANQLMYVGSSVNIERRWVDHKRDLNKNTHENPYLQADWNKYGGKSFVFDIIGICELSEELSKHEEYWIQKLESAYDKKGYNVNSTTRDMWNKEISKRKSAAIKRGMTSEVRAKISQRTKEAMALPEVRARHLAANESRRAKSSVRMKGCKLSLAHCASIGRSKKGHSFNKGIVRSKENREKISKRVKYLWTLPEYRNKVIKAHNGVFFKSKTKIVTDYQI